MKKFTASEIGAVRNYFTEQGYRQERSRVGGLEFTYFVVPQSVQPNLRDFVIRCTGDSAETVFGISDSVLEDFRQYAVAHEVIEFLQIGMDQPDRCAKSLEREISLVPDSIRKDYLEMRRNFFVNLIDYASRQPDDFNESDLSEFDKTLRKLEDLTK